MENGRDWEPEYAENAWAVHIWGTTRGLPEKRWKLSILRRYPVESRLLEDRLLLKLLP